MASEFASVSITFDRLEQPSRIHAKSEASA